MMNFHPHGRAFWEPVGAALTAYVFGGLFGMGLASIINGDKVSAALLWGGLIALFVWVIDHVAWLLIVARSYGPPLPAVVAPEIEPEAEPTEGRYMIQRADKTGSWVVEPGCTIEQLSRFAIAIMHDELSTTYQNMVVSQRIFQQQEYRAFLGWMEAQLFVVADGPKGEMKLTDIGKYFVKSIFERGIHAY
jgi:hypothetical protein